MKKLAVILGIAILSLSASSMRADGTNTTVFGTLTFASYGSANWFDPATGGVNPYVPSSGYGNSTGPNVVIGPGTEFAFLSQYDLYTADFTGNTLTITDLCKSAGCSDATWAMTFTDPAFLGFTSVSNSLGLQSSSFAGNMLTVNFNGAVYNKGYSGGTAVFDYTSPVPEPESIALLATGFLGIAGMIRRRYTA